MNGWPSPVGGGGSGGGGFNTDRAQLQQLATTLPETVHPGVHCGACGAQHLYGIRYKCAVCPAFDLCERCEDHADRRTTRGHPAEHPFLKIRTPLGGGPPTGPQPMLIGNNGPIGNSNPFGGGGGWGK